MKQFNKHIEWKTEFVNTETGEAIEQKKTVTVKVNTDNFYFTFIEAIGYLIGVTSGTELQVLSILCINAEYNKGICLLTSQRRKEFCNQLNITPNTFGICLSRLAKKGLITNNAGNIEINPICFWKGSIDERNKLLKDKGLELKIKFSNQ
jgi:hypothetical protein